MEHVDPEVLALASLGEPLADDEHEHLATCAQCSDEVAALSQVVAVGRSSAPGDTLVAPPAAVWGRIRDELGLDPALVPGVGGPATASGGTGAAAPGSAVPDSAAPDSTAPGSAGPDSAAADTSVPDTSVSGLPVAPGAPAPSGPASPAPGGSAGDGLAPVVELRRRRTAWVAAAAAAGLVVGGVGGAVWMDRVRAGERAAVVAEVALDALPGWSASGDAFVEQTSDGARTLVVTLDGDVDDSAFREVWLIDRDVTKLVSLGVLEGTDGRFSIPAGLDLAEFPVVDVSEEPFDGNPAHSGDSIIRGVLPA
ncbi:anti-sigma factor [Cellulomonas sp. NS3]|uniref:anti-sigma factor n=1 Tax=Cellulomonas sp. NS3 TaxID=2973977 RepID=UPI0021612277|nr:anti-sigma factor [Cellulomonas sp. NS3]